MKSHGFFTFGNYLFDKIALECDILTGLMRNSQRSNVAQSLCLVDDSVNKWQAFPVIYPHLTASYNSAELLLDLV